MASVRKPCPCPRASRHQPASMKLHGLLLSYCPSFMCCQEMTVTTLTEDRLPSPSPKPSMSESGLATTPSTLCSLWAYLGWLAGTGRGACMRWCGYPECHPPSSEPMHLPCPHGNVHSFLSPTQTVSCPDTHAGESESEPSQSSGKVPAWGSEDPCHCRAWASFRPSCRPRA